MHNESHCCRIVSSTIVSWYLLQQRRERGNRNAAGFWCCLVPAPVLPPCTSTAVYTRYMAVYMRCDARGFNSRIRADPASYHNMYVQQQTFGAAAFRTNTARFKFAISSQLLAKAYGKPFTRVAYLSGRERGAVPALQAGGCDCCTCCVFLVTAVNREPGEGSVGSESTPHSHHARLHKPSVSSPRCPTSAQQ